MLAVAAVVKGSAARQILCPATSFGASRIPRLSWSLHVHGVATSTQDISNRSEDRPSVHRSGGTESHTAVAQGLYGTILAPNPAKVASHRNLFVIALPPCSLNYLLPQERDEIIKAFPKLEVPFQRALRSLNMFITPEFIKWLDEGDPFLQGILNHLYTHWASWARDDSSLPNANHKYTIRSRVCVVDRIPLPSGGCQGCPGISFALSRWTFKGRGRSFREKKIDWQNEKSYITFRRAHVDSSIETELASVRLRPANTLFLNGRRSTMFVDKWVFDAHAVNGKNFVKLGDRGQVNRLSMAHPFLDPSLTVSLQRLTKPREIFMSMGNVISELVGQESSIPISASLELEESVSAFMSDKTPSAGSLSVFALITPKHAVNSSTNELEASVQPTLDTSDMRQTSNYIGLALSKGAHLHRVTSGGGGWGKKQGLLSLEPSMSFDDEDSVRTSVKNLENLGQGELVAQTTTKEILCPGDQVEFYGIWLPAEVDEASSREAISTAGRNSRDVRHGKRLTWADRDTNSFVLGVISPQASYDGSSAPLSTERLITIPHHFGMLSENGMVFDKLDLRSPPAILQEGSGTRIDIPRTVLTYSVPTISLSRNSQSARKNYRGPPPVVDRRIGDVDAVGPSDESKATKSAIDERGFTNRPPRISGTLKPPFRTVATDTVRITKVPIETLRITKVPAATVRITKHRS